MSNRHIKINSEEAIALFLSPTDPHHKLYEAMRALIVDNASMEEVSAKFQYKVSTLETLLSQTLNNRLEIFPINNKKPKSKKIPENLNATIVSLRNSGLSAHDILKELKGKDIKVAIRTVERTLKDFGFPKLKRRSNEELGLTTKNSLIPSISEKLDFKTLEPFSTDCPVVGVFFFLPYIIETGILDVVKKLPLPQSSVIGATQACLSMLLFKLIGGERLSQIQAYDHEPGLGLFAGLNVLPKATYMSTYSCRCSEQLVLDLQSEIVNHFHQAYPKMYASNTINLDFHSIPHFGEESEMEKVWCGAKGKSMKGANSIIAHDSGSNAIMYTRADILRSEEAEEIKKFIAYWKKVKGEVNEMLVFDCKFTTYKVLDEISKEVKFITLRKRNKALIKATSEIPEHKWKKMHIPIPKRKWKNISFIEERVTLTDCESEFRQITIKNHGRGTPTYVITNDFDMPIKEILIFYAKRWHVEQKIAELVTFFNLNALSSPLMIRIHFDIVWTVIADTLYHLMANDLRRFEKCLAPTIFKKFINMPGKITYDGKNFTIGIRKRAHTPILLSLEKLNQEIKVPWLDGKTITIKWLA